LPCVTIGYIDMLNIKQHLPHLPRLYVPFKAREHVKTVSVRGDPEVNDRENRLKKAMSPFSPLICQAFGSPVHVAVRVGEGA
jgi:hypothetical protein